MKKSYSDNPGSLKIDLMLRGIRVEDPVVKAWACGSSGIDIMLPQNTLVNIPCSDAITKSSPYVLRRSGDAVVITDGKREVPVTMVPIPKFYSRKTSTGVPFSALAISHGSYTVITPSPRCDFFNSKIECKYCAGNFNDEGKGKGVVYSVDEVLETVEAVLKEGVGTVIYLSIGFSDGPDGGIEFLKPYISAIKKHYSCLVAVEALPPKENHWIDETYAVGADSVLYNIEIFDPELFKIICPGRADLIGRKRYMQALEYATGVFPSGTVASHLIVGLEPPGSTCMGIDFLTDIGAVPILPIYRPSPGKALRIEPLDAEIILPVYKHLYNSVRKKKINLNWVRDISIITTPIDLRTLVGDDAPPSIFENFYRSKIGRKAAWGLSTLRRRLRVKGTDEPPKDSGH